MFHSGRSFTLYPFKVFYFIDESPSESRAPALLFGAGASKRNFKRAVDRNRIKRLIREAYRTQKCPLQQLITEQKRCCLQIFIIFTGKELPLFELIKTKMVEVLNRLEKEILKKV